MAKKRLQGENEKPEINQVKFHSLKSNFFRVAHADGVIGHVTPKRDIFIAFFNERIHA